MADGPAAHPMLIAELQSQIVEWISLSGASKETLCALALACKSFHELALQALWRTQDGLAPLLGTLPHSVFRIRMRYIRVVGGFGEKAKKVKIAHYVF
jgi:hypothetical protein